ncbi:MAG: acetyl-CoA C-acetyltransferase [Alphaproteobacteria bacterium]|nr:acetyl-CoA C-acetyltransferase [Alphaproteobacteria bacterium]
MKEVYIVDIKRTPVGKFLGALSGVSPALLAAPVINHLITTHKINPADVAELIMGNVLSAGHKQNIARQAAIHGGLPNTIPAYGINMVCGSGLKAVNQSFINIKSGVGEIYIAGGTESMSQAAYALPYTARGGAKMGDLKLTDTMIADGLTDAFHNYHMGITAENIAEKHGLTREEQDAFAFASQQKAIAAQDAGLFKDEIIPVVIKGKKGDVVVAIDEYINRDTTLEKLAKLNPAFKKEGGTVTAGNSSGLNDGAAAAIVASADYVSKNSLKPMAKIIAIGQSGLDPAVMGLGPVGAINNLLKTTDISINDVDIFELNEAFAAQSLGVVKELCEQHKLNKEEFMAKVNIQGGAIAIGHPIGSSGARVLTTLVHMLKRTKKKYGIASLCIGGGMGIAILVENIA